MYTCDQALELLSARLDGALTPEEEAGLEEHLAHCPDCQALAADLEEIHDAIPGLYQEPPPELKERVMAQIRAENTPISLDEVRKKRSGRKTWRSWGAMAAVMAVVFMSAVAMRFGDDGDTAGVPESTPVQSVSLYSALPEASEPAEADVPMSREAEAGDSARSTPSGDTEETVQTTQDETQADGSGVQTYTNEGAAKTAAEGQENQAEQGDGQESQTETASVTPFQAAEPSENEPEKGNSGAVPNEAMLMEGAEIDSAQPSPAGKVYYARLPEGWEQLFPDVAGIDAMRVTSEEAQAFLELLEEQGIPYTVEGDLDGEDGDVQLLSGLPE